VDLQHNKLIRSLDGNHLVSSGAGGAMGCANSMVCVADAAIPVDYMTIHIWPQNFGWIDSTDLKGTRAAGEQKTLAYIRDHRALAERRASPWSSKNSAILVTPGTRRERPLRIETAITDSSWKALPSMRAPAVH
jgi:endo-1,4-beta-mannosidase